jgi:hypothetical protein
MLSFSRLKLTVVFASALLLCALPLLAAPKTKGATKPGATRVKAHSTAPAARSHASSGSSHATSRVTSRVTPHATLHTTSHTTAARNSRSHHATPHATVHATPHATLKSVAAAKPHFRGQQSIDQARTIEIQEALIREHYLDGEASGEWDQATRDALARFQADNQWQTKVVPDARALIKLGLGPSRQNLLNPESAAMAMPSRSDIEKSSAGGSN